jgi:hypothetical protein
MILGIVLKIDLTPHSKAKTNSLRSLRITISCRGSVAAPSTVGGSLKVGFFILEVGLALKDRRGKERARPPVIVGTTRLSLDEARASY